VIKIYRFILILILLSIIIPAEYPNVEADETKESELMDSLVIKPGMTILDIGTGTGYYAYKFAERLKGTGKVFATDVLKNRIDYVREEANRRGFKNIYSVLVGRERMDEFYSKHRYDLIFLSNAYFFIDDPVNYFKEMRNYLADDGRLVILNFKGLCLRFYLDDFTDFAGLIKELSLEPASSPFYKALRASTQELIKQRPEGGPDELLKNTLVDDFNRMLANPIICANFLNGLTFKREVSFTPEEREFASRTLPLLDLKTKEGGFDITQKKLNASQFLNIMELNKLLIIQRFRKYLYEGGMAPYLSRSGGGENIKPENCKEWLNGWMIKREVLEAAGYKLESEYDLVSYGRKIMGIREVLEAAGYKLEDEYDLIPFRVVLIFVANKDKE